MVNSRDANCQSLLPQNESQQLDISLYHYCQKTDSIQSNINIQSKQIFKIMYKTDKIGDWPQNF